MTRWEYKIAQSLEDIHGVGALDALGRDGWELTGFDGRGIAFFKRPLPIVAVPSVPPKPAAPAAKPAAAKPEPTVKK